jgi:hypothetical protein
MKSNEIQSLFAKKPMLNNHLRNQREVNLVCNQLELKLFKNNNQMGLQQYRIDIYPEAPDITQQKAIFRELRSQMVEVYGNLFYRSGESLFSTKFVEADQEFKTETHTVKIKKTRNFIDLSQINTLTQDNVKVKAHIEMVIKAIFREIDGFVNFKNQYYDIRSKQTINGKLNVNF